MSGVPPIMHISPNSRLTLPRRLPKHRRSRARSSVVEQLTFNQLAEGSNPSGLTNFPKEIM